MLQLTSRDEAMLDWMNVVRLADVDAIRWALSAYQEDHDGPVSVRRANHWIARMAELGYLGRVRPVYRDRQIVWPTHQSSGRSRPRLFRQTMRHELAVASISARYLAAGYAWARDSRPGAISSHQADGVALLPNGHELVEVELTSKTAVRYSGIMRDHAGRLGRGDVLKVCYFTTEEVGRTVKREADQFLFRDVRPLLVVRPVLDLYGPPAIGAFDLQS
ncbi:MAG: hypothetical protein J0J03_09660 [Leifsonia sp.]|nr:hypothetical protein [Leifsonia sp.]